jgi:hypothetical protein
MQATDPVPAVDLKVRFAVVEDNIYETQGSNGITRHRYVMRDMLTEATLSGFSNGDSTWVNRTFPVDFSWMVGNLEVIVFVQRDDTKEVIQAGSFDYMPQEILVVDDDGSAQPLGYEDDYHELLCEMWMPFDGWPYSALGAPTSSDLAPYPVVIWLTGSTATSTLTTSDQTALSAYIDNGGGDLFLCGENIGADIGSSNFYRDYLHSTYVSDDTSESYVTGVSGDPISDPFYAADLQILSTSPSQIAPTSSGSTTFTYSIGGGTAAVKAVHDADSKIVYFAFLYFEGSDLNKMTVMGMVLGWLFTPAIPIDLSQGWNLISLPLEQFDTSFNSVLQSINGKYDSIQWYDITDTQDPWKHYDNAKPSYLNDLNALNHFISFNIHITTPGGTRLVCEGGEIWMGQQINLKQGWNMVGYPSTSDKSRAAALNNINFPGEVDAIWTFDSITQQWKELGPSDNFELCNGYWIHSLVDKTWDVPL